MAIKKDRLSGIAPGFALSFAISFMLGIYAPLDLYLTNIEDFWMKPSALIIPIIVCFVAAFAVISIGFIITRLINKKFYNACFAIATGLFVGFYIQGNFLIKNLPSMDGTTPNWDNPSERIKSIIAFAVPVIVALAVFLVFRKKDKTVKKVLAIGSICVSLMLVFTVSFLFISTDTSKEDILAPTYQNEFQLSEDKNVIVLILDAVDSDTFVEAMKDDGELEGMLDGFTYYDDALAAYPYTSRSIPTMFSGKWFENDSNFEDFRANVMDTSPFINKLEKENYKIGIYEQDDVGLELRTFEGRLDNCVKAEVKLNSLSSYKLILSMAAIKYAPWDLKFFGWNIKFYKISCQFTNPSEATFHWSDLKFYNTLTKSNPITTTDEKCARIIHLEGAHVPFQYDKNFKKVTGDSATYRGNIDACVTLVKEYISRLKESGVYDNSAIVILADHGYSLLDNEEEYMKSRLHPMLMVKGINETHDFQYSSAPVSYIDLCNAFVKLTDNAKSDEVFDCNDGDTVTRRYLLFAYTKEDHMIEFTTDGKANDTSAMVKTGKEFNAEK